MFAGLCKLHKPGQHMVALQWINTVRSFMAINDFILHLITYYDRQAYHRPIHQLYFEKLVVFEVNIIILYLISEV